MIRGFLFPLAGCILLGTVSACTAPVEPPVLTRRQPLPIERLALGPVFDRPAVERIATALAEGLGDPALGDALRDAVVSFYSETFDDVRDELQRVVLDEADDRAGLLVLLEGRVRDAPAFAANVREWRDRASTAPWRPVLTTALDLAGEEKTAPLVETSLVLLDPNWTKLLPAFPLKKNDRLPELFREVATLLEDEALRRKLFEALHRTFGGTAGPALVEAVHEAFRRDDGEGEAFARALERSLESRFQGDGVDETTLLDALLRLFETLDSPSDGLFAAAERAFADDPAIRHLAVSLVRVEIAQAIGRATARAVLEDFSAEFFLRLATEKDHNGPGFQELFGRVLDGFQQVLGPVPGDQDVRYASIAPGRFLPCFAIARWYQAAIRAQARTLSAIPADEFEKRFRAMPLDVPALTIDFGLEGPGETREIDLCFEAALKALFLEKALTSIRAAIAGQIAPMTATLPAVEQARIEPTFVAGVKAWDRTRPLADAFPTLRTLVDEFAKLPAGWLADFDGPNLWNGLHTAFRALPAKQVPRFRKLLFEDLKLQELSPSGRELVAKLFEKAPDGETLVAATLRDLGAFTRFVEPVGVAPQSVAEPLVCYRRLLGALPESAVDVPGRWFRVARTAGLGSEKGWCASPTLHHWLGSTERLLRGFRWVAGIAPSGRQDVLAPIARLFAKDTEEAWLDAFQRVSTLADALAAVATELVDAEGGFHGLVPATPDERAWLARKARGGSWVRAGAPLVRWLRGSEGQRLLPLFRQWASDGTWARLFEQFQWVKDGRLARWARCFARLEAAGIFRILLEEGAPGGPGSARP